MLAENFANHDHKQSLHPFVTAIWHIDFAVPQYSHAQDTGAHGPGVTIFRKLPSRTGQ